MSRKSVTLEEAIARIERAQTATWLLGEVAYGELSISSAQRDVIPAGLTISGAGLEEWTRDIVLDVLTRDLADAHRALKRSPRRKRGA